MSLHTELPAPTTTPVADLGSENISTREIDRRKMAHDASHYLMIPEAVATPRTAEEVAALLRRSRELGIPATFRSGGTSSPAKAKATAS